MIRSLSILAALGATARADELREEVPVKAAPAVERGLFLTGPLAARVDGRAGRVSVTGGYDSAIGEPVFETTAEVTLLGRFSVRAGGLHGATGFHPIVSGQVDTLREERHGLDVNVGLGYESLGFNTVPALVARVGVGRSIGAGRVLATASYGAGLEEDERYGDLRLRVLHPISGGLHAGLDGVATVDLERDDDEPPGEPDRQLQLGPVAAFPIGRYIVSATTALTTTKLRLVDRTRTGVISMASVSAIF